MIKGSSYVKNKSKAKGDYEQLLQTCGDVIEKNAYEDFIKTFSLDNIKLLVSQSVKDFGGDFLRLFNGEYRWVNIRLLFDNDLAPSEVILCFKEVDKEKQRELQERKLLEDSLNSAKQSAKAKYTFFNHMSHDMRTPLNAIIGLSELAYKNIDHNEKTAEYLQKIIISSHTLLDLVNDIFEFFKSRFENDIDFAKDSVAGVLSTGIDDMYDAYLKIEAIDAFRKKNEELFSNLLTVFKRVKNIIKS